MNVAIVHDWLTGMRGGEKVLEVLCELFSKATLFTLIHIKGSVSKSIEEMDIKTSFLQKMPFVKNYYRYYLPLMPKAIEYFDLSEFDLVISSSHCVAKGVRTKAYHICYCHTPMRYIWEMYDQYFERKSSNFLSKHIMRFFRPYLKKWDISTAKDVDFFIANSSNVRDRIWRYYKREASVIYPPVDTDFFTPVDEEGDYYLIVTAFAPYKRVDLAIESFNILGLPLKVIGTGPEEKRLKRIAKSNIEFIGWKSDIELRNYYARCKAFIFPTEEDFGITPLEAQATGRPVIAYKAGGALETVKEGVTGLFFSEQKVESLIEAVNKFKQMKFNKESIRKHAEQFTRDRFKEEIYKLIEKKLHDLNKLTNGS